MSKEPGKLPPRAKTASAYFEVTAPCWCPGCLLGTLEGSLQSCLHSIWAVTRFMRACRFLRATTGCLLPCCRWVADRTRQPIFSRICTQATRCLALPY